MKSTIALREEASVRMAELNASVEKMTKSFQETQKLIESVLLEAKTILQK